MRKLTRAVLETLKNDANNVVFEKDGFIKILAKNGDNILEWVNTSSLKFVVDNEKYDELEKECDSFWKEQVAKKCAGLSFMKNKEKIESEYSEHDKAMIASVRGNDKARGF